VPKLRASVILLFSFAAFCLFWRLDSFPDFFERDVPHGLKYQVEELYDNHVTPGAVTWIWQDAYANSAGRSPIFAAVNMLGLRLFGLSLLGSRLIPAAISFATLIFLFATLAKFRGLPFASGFTLLVVSSPFYLTLFRSGSILAFSANMAICAVCAALLYIRRPSALGLLCVAILTILLPYGHTSVRPVPVAIFVILLACRRQLPRHHLTIFFAIVFLSILPQFAKWPQPFRDYLNARGESLNAQFLERLSHGGDAWGYLVRKFWENFIDAGRILLGFNYAARNFWFPAIAPSWGPDFVLYFRFLVPFFLFGLWLQRKSWFWLAALLLSLAPGLFSGIGGPSVHRLPLLIFTVCYFIAAGIYRSVPALARKTVFVGSCVGIAILQAINFFYYPKEDINDFDTNGREFVETADAIVRDSPGTRIAFYSLEFLRGDYVMVHYLAGDRFKPYFASGQFRFLYDDALPSSEELAKKFDLLLAAHNYRYDLSSVARFEGKTPFGNRRVQVFRFNR
jgi:hypothetical protein